MVVFINEEARRILDLPEPVVKSGGQHYGALLHDHPDSYPALRVGLRRQGTTLAQPAELRLKPTGRVIGYTLSVVRDDRGRPHACRFLLQGPHAGGAGRGTRAAARPARGAGRNGGHHRPRSEEPAGEHRGDGRPDAAPGDRSDGYCRRCWPTSSTRRRWRTPSCSRCSSSSGRSGCRWIARTCWRVVEDAIVLAERKIARGGALIEVWCRRPAGDPGRSPPAVPGGDQPARSTPSRRSAAAEPSGRAPG